MWRVSHKRQELILKTINTMASHADAAPAKLNRAAKWAMAGLSLSMLMSSLDTSIANAALPTLALAFNASFQAVQWIVLAYLLSITALIVSAGRLGDMVGRRFLLIAGISLFSLASLVCGIAPSLGWLIVARAMQGLGAAVMMALTIAFVGDIVPKAQTGSAMGLLGTMSALGTTLGPSLGGLVIAGWGWRAIFLVNLPLGVLNVVLAWRYLPAQQGRARQLRSGFDFAGSLLLALSLICYALAMTLGRGHFSWSNTVLLVAAFIGAGLFVIAEKWVAAPLINLAMLRERSLRAGLAMSALVSTVMMTTLVVGPFYLSRAQHLESALLGLTLSCGPLCAALVGVPAGRLADRFGAARMTLAGLAGIACGALALSLLPAAFGVAAYVVPMMVMTSCYALFQASNNTLIMATARQDQRGIISGMLSLARNLGLITGASAMGAVFAWAADAADIATARPEAVAHGMRVTFALAVALIMVALGIAVRSQALVQENFKWQR